MKCEAFSNLCVIYKIFFIQQLTVAVFSALQKLTAMVLLVFDTVLLSICKADRMYSQLHHRCEWFYCCVYLHTPPPNHRYLISPRHFAPPFCFVPIVLLQKDHMLIRMHCCNTRKCSQFSRISWTTLENCTSWSTTKIFKIGFVINLNIEFIFK